MARLARHYLTELLNDKNDKKIFFRYQPFDGFPFVSTCIYVAIIAYI